MNRRLLILISFLVAVAAAGIGLIVADRPDVPQDVFGEEAPADASAIVPVMQANATVLGVVDGDTFEALLANGETWTIRLLGVDTPETVDPRKPVQCFGKEASQKLTDLIDGTAVRIEDDPEADEVDRYGRLLRNVYLTDGTDVNALLVREGYARELTSYPQNADRKAELRTLEREARDAGRGLWNPATCGGVKE